MDNLSEFSKRYDPNSTPQVWNRIEYGSQCDLGIISTNQPFSSEYSDYQNPIRENFTEKKKIIIVKP